MSEFSDANVTGEAEFFLAGDAAELALCDISRTVK